MFYVYILQSLKDRSYYTGFTHDLRARLAKHNRKEVRYSSAKSPWKLVWYAAFTSTSKALAFEKYLKQGSGFAFRNQRLI